MKRRLWIGAGVVIVILSVLGLILAVGSLASLPSTQKQLRDIVPNADAAIEQAAAQSRDKSYIGIGICLSTLACGGLLIRRGRQIARHP